MGDQFTKRQASSLKAERARRSMTQEQLAESIGVSKDAVTRWERGECVMSFETAYRIAKALNCPISDLCKP